jgi:hypothetical protein
MAVHKLPRVHEHEETEHDQVIRAVNETASAVEELSANVRELDAKMSAHAMALAIHTRAHEQLQYWARTIVGITASTAIAVIGTALWYIITHVK